MKLNEIRDNEGSHKRFKRVGRDVFQERAFIARERELRLRGSEDRRARGLRIAPARLLHNVPGRRAHERTIRAGLAVVIPK